jgi:hypothetical protein
MERLQLVEALVFELAGLPLERIEHPEYTLFVLEPAEASQLAYQIFVSSDGEPQLTAKLTSSEAATSESDDVVWAMSFERPDFASVEQMRDAFMRAVRSVLTHTTRVTCRRSPFLVTSRCDYEGEEGEWVRLAEMAWLKSAAPPRLLDDAKEAVFVAQPLAPRKLQFD